MKSLTKAEVPQVLKEERVHWTVEYVSTRARGEHHRGYWGHQDIRDALHNETEGRCAYCESRVAHVAYENVEHIRPKSVFPHLAHAWENLTTACPVCNTKKGDYYSDMEPLLHPYEDDPESHLEFLGGIPVARSGSALGYRSIKKLGLDRMQLVAARGERIRAVLELYYVWRAATGDTKDIILGALLQDAQDGEYPSAVKCCLMALGVPGVTG